MKLVRASLSVENITFAKQINTSFITHAYPVLADAMLAMC